MHSQPDMTSRKLGMGRAYLFELHILALGELLVAAPITAIAVALLMSMQTLSSHHTVYSAWLCTRACKMHHFAVIILQHPVSCAPSTTTCGMSELCQTYHANTALQATSPACWCE